MKAWNYLQKTLDFPLNTEIIRQAHGLMMKDERCLGGGNIESHQHLQVIIFLHQRVILKGTWKTQFLGFMRRSSYGHYKFVWKHQYASI